MSKTHELTVKIDGNIGSSFTSAFKKATAELNDFKQQSRQVQREIDRLSSDFRKGRIHESQYREETEKLTRELNQLERQQKRVNALKNFGSQAWSKTKAVGGMAIATGAIATTAAFAKSINTAADFEAQMAKVGAKSDATNAEMQALNKTAIKLGASSSLSSSEVAKGMDELAAKGMNARQIIEAMPGLVSATEASGESLDVVSDVVTSALNSYGMQAREASRVADIIAMSANQSAADVIDLGNAFKYAAPIANTLGISLEELSASTGILTDKGLEGQQAGTALRMALTRLSDPPTKAQKALNKLGISVTNSNGKFKSLAQLTEDWNKATKDLSETQKVAYASAIFGTEAQTAMLSLFEAGPNKIRETTRALEESAGSAEAAAKKIKDNYAGAKEQMFGAVESAQIAFASPILPVLKDTFSGISAMIEGNLPTIENAGKKVANIIDKITDPFQVHEKPVLNLKPNMTPEDQKAAIAQYQEELRKYELFGDMSFSDKVEYTLNEAVDTVENWMSGEGGKALDSIFTELGTLAGKAWLKSFTSALSGSAESFSEGNIVGGVAMATMANMMTGGLLGKGIFSGGKWAVGKGKNIYTNRKSKKAVETSDSPIVTKGNSGKRTKAVKDATKVSKGTKAIEKVTEGSSKIKNAKWLSKFGKVGKFGGKVLAPLAVLGYGADILTSDNKAQSIGSAVGGIAGGALGGAAAGAAIGSIVPGIGTAVGGVVGGIAGGFGGDWVGGKIGNWVGGLFGKNDKAVSTTPFSNNAVALDTTQLNSEIQKATNNASLLAQYLGQASGMIFGSFYPLQTSAQTAANNMSLLAMYTGQASGMIFGSVYPLQSNAQMAANNMSLLAMYSGQASGMVYGSFYPLQGQTNLATNNMSILTSYIGQASGMIFGPFNSLKNATDLATNNMNVLVSYIGQASGWIFSLNGIQTAAQRVIRALNNLESRINNVSLPSAGGRTSYE